jgi:hypothetical protein
VTSCTLSGQLNRVSPAAEVLPGTADRVFLDTADRVFPKTADRVFPDTADRVLLNIDKVNTEEDHQNTVVSLGKVFQNTPVPLVSQNITQDIDTQSTAPLTPASGKEMYKISHDF